jgi:hypothetical protein
MSQQLRRYGSALSSVILLEFPLLGCQTIAFVAGTHLDAIQPGSSPHRTKSRSDDDQPDVLHADGHPATRC